MTSHCASTEQMREKSKRGIRKWEEMRFKTTAEDRQSEGTAVTCDGRLFQRRAAATGKALSTEYCKICKYHRTTGLLIFMNSGALLLISCPFQFYIWVLFRYFLFLRHAVNWAGYISFFIVCHIVSYLNYSSPAYLESSVRPIIIYFWHWRWATSGGSVITAYCHVYVCGETWNSIISYKSVIPETNILRLLV